MKTWAVGDKVYIAYSGSGYGNCEYTPATVSKITPRGLIHVEHGLGVTVFNKDGYERGNRYGGYLDTHLSFDQRAEWLGEQEHIKYASYAIAGENMTTRQALLACLEIPAIVDPSVCLAKISYDPQGLHVYLADDRTALTFLEVHYKGQSKRFSADETWRALTSD